MDKDKVEDLVLIATIDLDKKVRMEVSLTEQEGQPVDLKETVSQISDFITDKLALKEDNSCKQQIFPLLAKGMVHSLEHLYGKDSAANLLGNEEFRYVTIHMLMVGFYLLKLIQQKD